MNNKSSAIFLATVLVTGIIGISSPFSAFAQELGYDSKYPPKMDRYEEKKYGSYEPYKPEKKDKPSWTYQDAKCEDNLIFNLNGMI